MSVVLSAFAGVGAQLFDNNGVPLTGGKIYTYAAGTTTPLATYTTNSQSAFHTNPIILDAAGRVPNGGEIWLQLGIGYKFVLKDSNDVLIATYDNIPSSAQPPAANDADSIMYEQGYTVTAGSFVSGKIYRIASVGTTNFTAIGAVNNTVGTHFIATGAGTGTGTAELSQTVETRLQTTVYVTDFGAFKDGTNATVTTAAINAAIAYAKASSNVHCIEFPTGNYAVNAPIEIKGGFGDGLTVKGNKSTVTGSHNGPVFDLNGSLPAPAPEYRLNVLIQDFTVVGSGKANTGSRCIQIVDGANVQINNCLLRNAYKGLYGFGALICNFIQLNIRDNYAGVEFLNSTFFAPNDIHFVNCQIIVNTVAVRAINFDYGSWNFYGCEIEGNNLSGNATDGIRVCEFFGAGEVNFIGCHFEENSGQYNLFFDSPEGRHLNIIGCKMIPGDNAGSIVYVDSGELFLTGTHAAQNVGGNIVLTANTDNAFIVGDTAGTVTGVQTKLTRIRNGQVNVGGAAVGATSAGVSAKGSLGIGYVVEGNIQFNNSSGTRLGYLNESQAILDAAAAYTIGTGIGTVTVTRAAGVGFGPGADNTQSLGEASFRWSQVYAGNGTINTSDERSKQQIEAIPQTWLDAWGDVDYMRFKFNDAVQEKGNAARWHIGLIAQRVKEAFEARGINPFTIGLLCFDQWDDIEIEKQVEDVNGNFVFDEETGEPVMQKHMVKVAGNQYGIRYEQALALECAYLRNKLKG
jgi:hypothetical protein